MPQLPLLRRLTLPVQHSEDLQSEALSKVLLDALPLVARLDDPLPTLPSPLRSRQRLRSLEDLGPLPTSDDADGGGSEFEGFFEDGKRGGVGGEVEGVEHLCEVRVGAGEFAIPHDETGKDTEEFSIWVDRGGVSGFRRSGGRGGREEGRGESGGRVSNCRWES
jgi:hypothetical protein